MFKISIHIFLLLYLIFVISCSNVEETKNDLIIHSEKIKNEYVYFAKQGISENWENSEGIVLEDKKSKWKVTKNLVGNSFPILSLFFLDDNNGWAGSKNYIYKTIDSGKNWESIPISFIGDADVKSLYFTDVSRGWIVLQRNGSKFSYSEEDKIDVFRTEDGGRNWELSYTENSVVLTDTHFSDTAIWIVGKKFIGYSPLRLEPLIVRYIDETKEWKNISNSVKDIFTEKESLDYTFPILEAVTTTNLNCIAVITNKVSLIQSCNNGDDWQLTDVYENKVPQIGINKFGFEKDYLWILEAAGGVEGTVSRLITVPLRDQREKVKITALKDVYLNYGYWITSQEFIACGTRNRNKFNKIHDTNDIVKNDVILLTQDGGKTWDEIYKSPNNTKFNLCFITNINLIWIIDENSHVKKITKLGISAQTQEKYQ